MKKKEADFGDGGGGGDRHDDSDKEEEADFGGGDGDSDGDDDGDGDDDVAWTTDHDLVRSKCRVAKYFDDPDEKEKKWYVPVQLLFRGTVSKYAPATGSDPALWRVVFDDGDFEDYEEEELAKYQQLYLKYGEEGDGDWEEDEKEEKQTKQEEEKKKRKREEPSSSSSSSSGQIELHAEGICLCGLPGALGDEAFLIPRTLSKQGGIYGGNLRHLKFLGNMIVIDPCLSDRNDLWMECQLSQSR